MKRTIAVAGTIGAGKTSLVSWLVRRYGITPMLDPEIAVLAATNFRRLRSLGVTIRSSVDLVVATYCLAHGHQLLHDDRDFDHFERHLGLRVLH